MFHPQPFGNVKTVLSSQAVQKQMEGWAWPEGCAGLALELDHQQRPFQPNSTLVEGKAASLRVKWVCPRSANRAGRSEDRLYSPVTSDAECLTQVLAQSRGAESLG